MRKTVIAMVSVLLITLFTFSLLKKYSITPSANKNYCKKVCSGQDVKEDRNSSTGFIFWDIYSSQVLNIQATSCVF